MMRTRWNFEASFIERISVRVRGRVTAAIVAYGLSKLRRKKQEGKMLENSKRSERGRENEWDCRWGVVLPRGQPSLNEF